jgi:hypothetical protein
VVVAYHTHLRGIKTDTVLLVHAGTEDIGAAVAVNLWLRDRGSAIECSAICCEAGKAVRRSLTTRVSISREVRIAFVSAATQADKECLTSAVRLLEVERLEIWSQANGLVGQAEALHVPEASEQRLTLKQPIARLEVEFNDMRKAANIPLHECDDVHAFMLMRARGDAVVVVHGVSHGTDKDVVWLRETASSPCTVMFRFGEAQASLH